jgi:glycosyltransferase involved in cell wall biosynthesis
MGMPDKASFGGPVACEPPFVEELQKLGVRIDEQVYVYGGQLTKRTGLFERINRVIRTAWKLRQRLQDQNFDVLHLNTSFDRKALLRDLATLFIIRSYKGSIFLKMHGSDEKLLRTNNRVLVLLMRLLFSGVDGIGVLSSEERDNFIRARVDRRKLFRVKCALKKGVYERDPSFMSRHGFSDETPALLFISRFIPAKGLMDAVRACRIVADKGYDFALFCVGDGPARQEAEAEVERLGLQRQVRFFGHVEEAETDKFFANSSMMLLPTYHCEGLPLVILHSLAAGTPIVTTRIRGAADYLRAPENCLWIEPKNPQMLADKIIELLSSPETMAAMSENNLKLAEQFAAQAMAEEYEAIYSQLIEEDVVGDYTPIAPLAPAITLRCE